MLALSAFAWLCVKAVVVGLAFYGALVLAALWFTRDRD